VIDAIKRFIVPSLIPALAVSAGTTEVDRGRVKTRTHQIYCGKRGKKLSCSWVLSKLVDKFARIKTWEIDFVFTQPRPKTAGGERRETGLQIIVHLYAS